MCHRHIKPSMLETKLTSFPHSPLQSVASPWKKISNQQVTVYFKVKIVLESHHLSQKWWCHSLAQNYSRTFPCSKINPNPFPRLTRFQLTEPLLSSQALSHISDGSSLVHSACVILAFFQFLEQIQTLSCRLVCCLQNYSFFNFVQFNINRQYNCLVVTRAGSTAAEYGKTTYNFCVFKLVELIQWRYILSWGLNGFSGSNFSAPSSWCWLPQN